MRALKWYSSHIQLEEPSPRHDKIYSKYIFRCLDIRFIRKFKLHLWRYSADISTLLPVFYLPKHNSSSFKLRALSCRVSSLSQRATASKYLTSSTLTGRFVIPHVPSFPLSSLTSDQTPFIRVFVVPQLPQMVQGDVWDTIFSYE